MDALSPVHSHSSERNTSTVPDALYVNALPRGTLLQGFELGAPLGQGGFSIVYAATDTTLCRPVAVKEYMPSSFASRTDSSQVVLRSQRHKASFATGLESFIEEARLLARFKHPSLVEVLSFWEENGSAYMAMPLYDGQTLRQTLRDNPACTSEARLKRWLAPLLDVLEILHEQQVFHRDIAPDNIIIQPDGTPVLLDLGSARKVVADSEHAPTVVVKAGYAPIEQYAEDKGVPQGPWTDIYALGATLYYAITGRAPSASVSRMMKDSLVLLSQQTLEGYSPEFLEGIDRALALQPEERPQSVAELRKTLAIDSLPASEAAQPFSVSVAGAAYEDEEQTVILSAQELEQLLTGGAQPETGTVENDNLFDSLPKTDAEVHAFADMEEFLNPVNQQVHGQLLVPCKQDGTEGANTSDIEFAEVRSDKGQHKRRAWILGGAGAGLLAVLLTAVALPERDKRQQIVAATPALPLAAQAMTNVRSEQAGRQDEGAVEFPKPSRNVIAISDITQVVPLPVSPAPVNAAGIDKEENEAEHIAATPEQTANLGVLDNEPVLEPAPSPASAPAQERQVAAKVSVASPVQRAAQVAPKALPAAVGKVALSVQPWGEVWVDGELKGVTPPLRSLELSTGLHSIEVRSPGFNSLQRTIDVQADMVTSVTYEFSATDNVKKTDQVAGQTEQKAGRIKPLKSSTEPVRFGYANIRVKPWAEVWVNGKQLGVAPPLNELRLAEGVHTVEFRNPNFPIVSQTVTISSAERSTLVQLFD